MTRTSAVGRLPWVLLALTLLLTATGDGLLIHQTVRLPSAPQFYPWPGFTLNALTFGGVGAVIALRRRENPIGWLFGVIGLMSGVGLLSGHYAMYSRYVRHDGLAGAAVSGWVCAMTSAVVLTLLPFVLLRFPDGRFLSRRWQRFGTVAWLLSAITVAGLAVIPGEMGLTPGITNPYGAGIDSPIGRVAAGAPWEAGVGAPLLFCMLAGVASLILRGRRSGAEQRTQLKWILFAAAAGFSAIAVTTPLDAGSFEWVHNAAWNVGLAIIPAAAGASILKYRLYDIDRIVSRTVSYAVITGLLVAVYAGLVTGVSRLLPSDSKSLAVAASTLAVAALLQPLRRRVQAAVDRRFNRARYDSARTVEAFSQRLREQVDLTALEADLLAVVGQTLQPASAGLWLRRTSGAAS